MNSFLSKIRFNYHTWRYNYGQNIKYYNFWTDQQPGEMWLSIFIRKHFPHADKKRINITSVLGPEWMLNDNRKGINIFYSGENLHTQRFIRQAEYLKKSKFDLYIDFDESTEKHHIRIPIWMLWCFPPDGDMTAINDIVKRMRFPETDNTRDFCCMVSSHDWSGLRGEIMDSMQKIGKVNSAGVFRHNTDALKTIFCDNKVSFMRQYKFAICPENSNTEGYVTEKIFDTFLSGCIPIYQGSNNNPEPRIINQDAVIFWDPNSENSAAIDKVQYLMATENHYREFVGQPRLISHAEEYIAERYYSLHQSLSLIL